MVAVGSIVASIVGSGGGVGVAIIASKVGVGSKVEGTGVGVGVNGWEVGGGAAEGPLPLYVASTPAPARNVPSAIVLKPRRTLFVIPLFAIF